MSNGPTRGEMTVCLMCYHYNLTAAPRLRCNTPRGVRMTMSIKGNVSCCSQWMVAAQYSHIVQRLMQVGSEAEARARRTIAGLILSDDELEKLGIEAD